MAPPRSPPGPARVLGLSVAATHSTLLAPCTGYRSVGRRLKFLILSAGGCRQRDSPGHTIETVVDQAEQNLPADRLQTLAYDKAADDGKVHEMLHDRDIKPVIENRTCRPKDGEQEKVIGDRVPLHVVHDEAGTVFCYDTTGATPVRWAMSYAGHEKDRGTLKYRCPAKVAGFACASDAKCNAEKSYGLTVRVDQEMGLRRYPRSRGRRRSSSGCTKAARRWNGSTTE